MADRRKPQRSATVFRASRGLATRVFAVVVLVAGAAFVAAAPAGALAPDPPFFTSIVPGPGVGEMTLRWQIPATVPAASIVTFEYRVQVDGGAFGPAMRLAGPTARKTTVPCAAPSTPPASSHGCNYEIRASNGTMSVWSDFLGATWTFPSPPVLGSALAGPAPGTATLKWLRSKDTGGLAVTYAYEVSTSGSAGPFSAPTAIDDASIVPLKGLVVSVSLPCPFVSGSTGCTYVLLASNAVGTSSQSRVRPALFRRPRPPTAIQATTTSVALGTGVATQTVTWTPPANTGGLALTDNVIWACATANGTVCKNASPGWASPNPVAGAHIAPPGMTTTNLCPANGACGYEVWPTNAIGHSWAVGSSRPSPPTVLTATRNTTVPGQVDLQWLNTLDAGSAFGHYVLFECDGSQNCSNGEWTSDPAAAGPWNRVDLSNSATTASYHCAVTAACTFRIGYVDADGAIGGVTNAASVTGAET